MKRRALAVVRRRALALVVVLLVAGVPAASALLIAALLACPLVMLSMFATPAAVRPVTCRQLTIQLRQGLSPSLVPVDRERSLR